MTVTVTVTVAVTVAVAVAVIDGAGRSAAALLAQALQPIPRL